MGLEEHNRDRLTWWSNHDWPDRIAGRFNSEQPMEARKLESRVIIKKGALDRIDALYGCEQDHEDEPRTLSKELAATDSYLLKLFFEWLPTQGPGEIYYKAARQVLLSDSVAGGVIELERLEKMGEAGYIVTGEVASLARKAFELILEKTVQDGYRLDVERDERARTKMQAYHQDRGDKAESKAEWIRKKYNRYREDTQWVDSEIKKRLADDYSVSLRTVQRFLRDDESA